MAKRFTDTNKYKSPFIRSIKGPYKLLWDYIYHDCSHAGIWIVDFEIAQIYIGEDMSINIGEALKVFNSNEVRIVELDEGKKWFIPSFVEFQYGELNTQNKVHASVLKELKKYCLIDNSNIILSPIQGAKEIDKVKIKNKVKEKELIESDSIGIPFEEFWNLYDKKRGDKDKIRKKWMSFSDEERKTIMKALPDYVKSTPDKLFRKDPQKYLYHRGWEDELLMPGGKKLYTNYKESSFD